MMGNLPPAIRELLGTYELTIQEHIDLTVLSTLLFSDLFLKNEAVKEFNLEEFQANHSSIFVLEDLRALFSGPVEHYIEPTGKERLNSYIKDLLQNRAAPSRMLEAWEIYLDSYDGNEALAIGFYAYDQGIAIPPAEQ